MSAPLLLARPRAGEDHWATFAPQIPVVSMWIGSGRDECRRGRDMRIIDACDDHAPEFQALHSVHGAHGHPVRRMLFSVTGAPHMPIEALEGFGDVAELDLVVADPQLANTPSTSFR